MMVAENPSRVGSEAPSRSVSIFRFYIGLIPIDEGHPLRENGLNLRLPYFETSTQPRVFTVTTPRPRVVIGVANGQA